MMDEPPDDAAHQPQPDDVEEPEQPDLSRLNDCARVALDLARAEAIALGAVALHSEHLLLGLASTPGGAARRVLERLQLDADGLRAHVRFIIGPVEDGTPTNEPLAFSPRVNRVLVLAGKEAAKRGSEQIGTLHLLTGLLRERVGIAVVLLETPGVGLELAGSTIAMAHREGWQDT